MLSQEKKTVVQDLERLDWHPYRMDLIEKKKEINRQNVGKQELPLEMHGNHAPQNRPIDESSGDL